VSADALLATRHAKMKNGVTCQRIFRAICIQTRLVRSLRRPPYKNRLNYH
jgi:hypothetical protein